MSVPRLPAKEAAHLLEEEGYVYLDVRTEEEFALGHPAGAYNVPFQLSGPNGPEPNREFLVVIGAVFPKDAKLVVGCRSGNRSRGASEALVAAGYTTVVEQRAGFAGVRDAFGRVTETGWERSGLEVACSAEPGRSYAELRARAEL